MHGSATRCSSRLRLSCAPWDYQQIIRGALTPQTGPDHPRARGAPKGRSPDEHPASDFWDRL